MGFLKANAVPLLIGVAIGYLVVPRAISMAKNR